MGNDNKNQGWNEWNRNKNNKKINEMRHMLFIKKNEVDKLLAKLTQRKREHKFITLEIKRGDIIRNTEKLWVTRT